MEAAHEWFLEKEGGHSRFQSIEGMLTVNCLFCPISPTMVYQAFRGVQVPGPSARSVRNTPDGACSGRSRKWVGLAGRLRASANRNHGEPTRVYRIKASPKRCLVDLSVHR
jgi:hypothetical protein